MTLFNCSIFFKGSANQRFNNLPPIGEMVLSITSKRVTAFTELDCKVPNF